MSQSRGPLCVLGASLGDQDVPGLQASVWRAVPSEFHLQWKVTVQLTVGFASESVEGKCIP